jgi:alcohol dehydrogenase (cytochrome c)
VLDRTNGKFLHGTPFVKSLNWSKGLTPEGRPLVDEAKSPSVLGTEVCPSTAGATNWPSPAYDPDTHYFYLIATEGCSINYKASDKFQPSSLTDQGTSYVEGKGEQAHWQSYVRALDLTTGKQMWEYKLIGTNHYGPGLLSTAGGLIFAGDNQGIFSALDARTGKSLWHFSVGEKITASPMAYAVNGKEFVALLAGPNVVVFGLPDGP